MDKFSEELLAEMFLELGIVHVKPQQLQVVSAVKKRKRCTCRFTYWVWKKWMLPNACHCCMTNYFHTNILLSL